MIYSETTTRISAIIYGAIAISMFMLGCGNESGKEGKSIKAEQDIPVVKTVENTFPFSQTSYVEALSYPDRLMWDTPSRGYSAGALIAGGKLAIDIGQLHERVRLTGKQQTQLLGVLYRPVCTDVLRTRCYAPRHAFIFYDNESRAFAAMEICLQCNKSEVTNGIEPIELCDERGRILVSFLEEVGINSFGD